MKVKELIKLLLEASENEEVRIIEYKDNKDIGASKFLISEIKDVEYSKAFENYGVLIVIN